MRKMPTFVENVTAAVQNTKRTLDAITTIKITLGNVEIDLIPV